MYLEDFGSERFWKETTEHINNKRALLYHILTCLGTLGYLGIYSYIDCFTHLFGNPNWHQLSSQHYDEVLVANAASETITPDRLQSSYRAKLRFRNS